MLIRKFLASTVAVLVVAGMTVMADDIKVDGIQCVVAPRAAKAEQSVEYKEGKVFFCCGNCPKKFAEDKEKFAPSANAQLVATKQYKQEKCPFTGGPLNPETELEVGQAKVKFCCNNCRGKVATADAAKQKEMVFADKPFEKAFVKAESKSE